MFSDKGGIRDKIVLVENSELISEDVEIAETFNNFFCQAVEAMGVTENKILLNTVGNSEVGVDKCIKMFEAHPSIINIKSHVKVDSEFVFLPEDMEKKLAALDPKNNGGCVPTKF